MERKTDEMKTAKSKCKVVFTAIGLALFTFVGIIALSPILIPYFAFMGASEVWDSYISNYG